MDAFDDILGGAVLEPPPGPRPSALREWGQLPSWWIEEMKLTEIRWGPDGRDADNIAALMALAVISHRADTATRAARRARHL